MDIQSTTTTTIRALQQKHNNNINNNINNLDTHYDETHNTNKKCILLPSSSTLQLRLPGESHSSAFLKMNDCIIRKDNNNNDNNNDDEEEDYSSQSSSQCSKLLTKSIFLLSDDPRDCPFSDSY